MNPENLELPAKGFTKRERAWLAQVIQAIRTVQALQGRNTSITDTEQGQVINAEDCEPCP